MPKIFEYTPDLNLKKIIGKDNFAEENGVVSIATSEGWKTPMKGDFIRETDNGWNVISNEDIEGLAYSLENMLSAACPIDTIELYYIDFFSIPVLRKVISKVGASVLEKSNQNSTLLLNLLKLVTWIEGRYYI